MNHSHKLSLFLVLMVAFIDHLGIGIVFPMFSAMIYQEPCALLPIDASAYTKGMCLGTLLAAMPITQFFSSPILGTLSDQKGRKFILSMSLLIGVIGYLLGILGIVWNSLFVLLISRICVGISAGSTSVVSASIADLSTPETKSRNFGYYSLACGLSFTIGPYMGGVLSGVNWGILNGFSLSFLSAGVITLINLLLILYYYTETLTKKSSEKISLTLGIKNIKKAFLLKNLCTLFVMAFFIRFGWSFYWYLAPVTWINENGFTTTEVGELYAYGSAIFALSCAFLINPILERFSPPKVLFYSAIGCGVTILMLVGDTNVYWLLFCVSLQQYFMALVLPTITTLISNSVGQDMQGETLGVQHSVQSLAIAISPLISGAMLGLYLEMPIIIGGLSMLVSSVILALFSPIFKKNTTSNAIQIELERDLG